MCSKFEEPGLTQMVLFSVDLGFIVRDLTYLAKDVLLSMDLNLAVRNLTHLANEILLALGPDFIMCT